MALTKSDKDDIKQIFVDSFPVLFKDASANLGKDIAYMRSSLLEIRQVQGQHSLEHADQRIVVNDLKSSARGQAVMLEDLESRFITLCEAVDDNLTVRSQVRDHETRLTTVESVQSLIQETVREHSRQLNILTTYEH